MGQMRYGEPEPRRDPARQRDVPLLIACYRCGPELGEFAEWATRADRHAADASAKRAYTDMYLAFHRIVGGKPAEGHVHLRRAVERASQLGNEAAFLKAAGHG